MKAEIKLTTKEIEEIVRQYIVQKFETGVLGIRFEIDRGYQDRMESTGPSLKEVVVTINLESNR